MRVVFNEKFHNCFTIAIEDDKAPVVYANGKLYQYPYRKGESSELPMDDHLRLSIEAAIGRFLMLETKTTLKQQIFFAKKGYNYNKQRLEMLEDAQSEMEDDNEESIGKI